MRERKAPPDGNQPERTSETWEHIPWRKLERHCFRIQKRIFQASQRGNQRAVHKLQKLLLKSRAARTLAVRRVSQDNQGKNTAGVDGVKSLTPEQRLVLVEEIQPGTWPKKSLPVRRMYIPKPGKDEKRPLGIPTLAERARQMLAKLALEPEWEAKFEPNSYGFRPGRSCHDAIEAIFSSIKQKDKYVLDADIADCFDHINHQALLKKLSTFPHLSHAIRAWLQAGALDNTVFVETEAGTPQGGVISPLLANIALHGLETAIIEAYRSKEGRPQVIRYADDFVVLHPTEEGVEKARAIATAWLKGMGLELKPSKTRVAHTLKPIGGCAGFEFLGFTIRQFPVGKTHAGKNPHGKPLGFKTLIKPSKGKIQQHLRALGKTARALRDAPQERLIKELNPQIAGWSNYYRTVISKDIFAQCDSRMYSILRAWAKRRHPNKDRHWVVAKYWKTTGNRHWVFGGATATLRAHQDTRIKRHVKVKETASPYDGKLLYWSQRLKEHPMLRERLPRLLQRQKGRCQWCGLFFQEGDLMEIDHMDGIHSHNVIANLMVLHRHCHDQRHADARETGIHDKDCPTEEPCEAKVSRTVLKPSRGGDSFV